MSFLFGGRRRLVDTDQLSREERAELRYAARRRDALWFSAFGAVATLIVMAYFLSGRHALQGALAFLYLALPGAVSVIVWLLARPRIDQFEIDEGDDSR